MHRLQPILSRALRPVAFIGAAGALGALWWHYYHAPELSAGIPENLRYGMETWLRPLYAIDRVPIEQYNGSFLEKEQIDIVSSPVFDRFLLASLVALVCAVLVATAVAQRWWTPLCLLLTLGSVLAINVFVARVPDGDTSFVQPFMRPGLEYYCDLGLVGDDPIAFIRDYSLMNHRGGLSHHAGTHPPGGVLFLYYAEKWLGPKPPTHLSRAAHARESSFLSRLFGASAAPTPDEPPSPGQPGYGERSLDTAVWTAVGFTALAVLPSWWLARMIGGAATARRLLPIYLATPNLVLYGATSMDGVFLTFGVTALALGVAAMRQRWSWIWTLPLTLLAGVALWVASFMTFASIGVALLLICYAMFVTVGRPRRGIAMVARLALLGLVTAGCQLAAQRWLSYDLHATLEAAMRRDKGGLGFDHVAGYTSLAMWRDVSVANGFAWVLGSGVALSALALVALAHTIAHGRLRKGPAAAFAPALALCVLLLAGSRLFTFETERVWLYLTPALIVVAATQFRGCVVWTLLLTASFAQVFWIETQHYTYW